MMYVAVRDGHPASVFGTIKAGLDAMRIDAVELSYSRDRSVGSLDSNVPGAHESLANKAAIEQFAYKCKGLKIRPSALILSNDFGASDLKAELDWVVSAVRAAGQLGMKAIRIDPIRAGGGDSIEKAAQQFGDCVKQVLDATKDLNVALGIENHGGTGNRREFLDAVFSYVESPRLGLTLDTGNFYWSGLPLSKVYETIKHFAPKVKHTHIKSINYPADQREVQRPTGWEYGKYCSPLKLGDINFKLVIGMLKDAGYDGDLCIENESLGRFKEDTRKSILKSDAGFLKDILDGLGIRDS